MTSDTDPAQPPESWGAGPPSEEAWAEDEPRIRQIEWTAITESHGDTPVADVRLNILHDVYMLGYEAAARVERERMKALLLAARALIDAEFVARFDAAWDRLEAETAAVESLAALDRRAGEGEKE